MPLTTQLLIILIGFAPAALFAWLAFRFINMRSRLLSSKALLAYLFGVAFSVPVYYYEKFVEESGVFDFSIWWQALLAAFIIVAIIEEVFKGLGLYLAERLNFIDEPLDVLALSTIVAMGFAGVENILYSQNFGWETALFRVLTSLPVHFICGLLMGFFIAMNYRAKRSRIIHLVQGVGMAIVYHGIYDFFIIQEFSETLLLGALVVLFFGLILGFLIIRRTRIYQASEK